MDRWKDYKRQTFTRLAVEPGHRVLEIGCGAGEDALALAALAGASGRVIGIDTDRAAIAQARERARVAGLRAEFQVGDAHALALADATFDACRADCTFQHLESPRTALAELVRVARPGARIVVSEPDWETLVVAASDRAVTRGILACWCDRIVRNGWIGRELAGLFRAAGLLALEVVPATLVLPDLETASSVCPLAAVAELAAAQGLVTRAAAAAWLAELEESSRGGRFFGAVTGFVVSGRRS